MVGTVGEVVHSRCTVEVVVQVDEVVVGIVELPVVALVVVDCEAAEAASRRDHLVVVVGE